jgi:hypothetical protein
MIHKEMPTVVDIQLYDEDGNLKDEARPEPPAPSEVSADDAAAAGQHGEALVQVIGPDGEVKEERRATNLITDAGDLYYAAKAITGIAPASPAAPTAMSGMKLGTGTTAAAKAGAGAALVTYISGSNNLFDASFPVTQNLGAGLGVNGQYKTTWAAADVTNSAITEAVIVNDAATDATSSAANTSHRVVFTAINKTAADTLVITWNAKFLGV